MQWSWSDAESIGLIDYAEGDDITINDGLSTNEEMIRNVDSSYTPYLLLFRRWIFENQGSQ
jgi:hypothetical protein